MRFDTVILYDIENLTKGYSFNRKIEQGLSLKEITHNVESLDIVKNVAIKRAYANWSDLRLKFLRNEILELGIEPVQLFGFSANQGKNAADIQLAIDAMDIVHTRLFVNVFVIISGDGAFSALAKKLHEYGKIVIGGAYQSATSKVFESVCDHFISIEDPDTSDIRTEQNKTTSSQNIRQKRQEIQSLKQVIPLNCLTSGREEILSKAKETIEIILSDCKWRDALRTGTSPSVFKEVFDLVLQNMSPQKLGFQKFSQFLRCIFKDTDLCLYSKPPSDVKIGLRSQSIHGYEILSDLEPSEPHSPGIYRSLLMEKLPGKYPPSCEEITRVYTEFAKHDPNNETLQETMERLSVRLNADWPETKIKAVFLLLQSTGFLGRSFQDHADAVPDLGGLNLSHDRVVEEVLKYLADIIRGSIGEEPQREVLILSLGEPKNDLGDQAYT